MHELPPADGAAVMRRAAVHALLFLVLSLAVALSTWSTSPAFAYDEPGDMPEQHVGSVLENCVSCHRPDESGILCSQCHASHGSLSPMAGKGPHGAYTTTTDRCEACHDVHEAGGTNLLPSATVTGSCYSCHDGTGGKGVYGVLAARGVTVGARHGVDVTNTVPGGNAASGGSGTMSFGGPGGTMGCDDCHSPHDANTVGGYKQERNRTTYTVIYGYNTRTNKLLKRNPGSSTATAALYGSDWCLACHKGRSSAGPVHNHPVDSLATTTSPFAYDLVALLNADTPTSVTATGSMARTNRGYLMPWPRTAQQAGHSPICQQCHEDTRLVGTLSADGLIGDAEPFSVTATDGNVPTDNPRFQNFPHETQNTRFLVETNDDLCTNCHPPTVLP